MATKKAKQLIAQATGAQGSAPASAVSGLGAYASQLAPAAAGKLSPAYAFAHFDEQRQNAYARGVAVAATYYSSLGATQAPAATYFNPDAPSYTQAPGATLASESYYTPAAELASTPGNPYGDLPSGVAQSDYVVTPASSRPVAAKAEKSWWDKRSTGQKIAIVGGSVAVVFLYIQYRHITAPLRWFNRVTGSIDRVITAAK